MRYGLPDIRVEGGQLGRVTLERLYFIVELEALGVSDERVERTVLLRKVGRFEELLAYIFEDEEDGKFAHRFASAVPEWLQPAERCKACEKKHRNRSKEPASPGGGFKRFSTANLFFCKDQLLLNNAVMERALEEQQSDASPV